MFETTGTLRYSTDGSGYWLIAELDTQIGAYYRALLPKWFGAKAGRHDTHCTVVRGGRDVPSNVAAWGKYEGERVLCHYEPGLLVAGPYYYLRVVSKRFEEIRQELGLLLDNGAYEPPPPGYAKWFHITVANAK